MRPARCSVLASGATEVFVPRALPLRLGPVLRFHGYRDLAGVPPEVVAVAQDTLRIAETLVEPRLFWVLRRIEHVGGGTLTLADGPTFHAGGFDRHCAGARHAACLVATAGRALDDRIAALGDGADGMLEAVFLEAAGSVAVQETLKVFRVHLSARAAAEGFRLGPRLGPGYGDWPLTEQPDLFSVFDGSVPVRLTEACVMVPLKSISGLIPLFEATRQP